MMACLRTAGGNPNSSDIEAKGLQWRALSRVAHRWSDRFTAVLTHGLQG
jgi:hypothetical protein